MSAPETDVPARLRDRTERIVADLREEWGEDATIGTLDYGPKPWYPDAVPDTVDAQLDEFAGMASVVVFYTPRHEETVLVYHRGSHWEPPGGAVEGRDALADTAVREAREETGLDVELTDLCYTGTVRYHYDDGGSVLLPVATFVGHRTSGRLRVERERIDHPGVTRGVGLFGPGVLPENCRDREWISSLFDGDGE